MEMSPAGEGPTVTAQRLDVAVPSSVLRRRRNGISFCSSSTYLTTPRFQRRGGISYERADKNAIYVRSLGDGRSRGKKVPPGAEEQEDARLIRKVSRPHYKVRLRRRFLSQQRQRSGRRSALCRTQRHRHLLEEGYSHPAKMVRRCDQWDFDIFHFDVLTGGRPLLYLSYHIFHKQRFFHSFKLDVLKLLCFVARVEDNYHDNNPYHNVLHAADVTQAMYCFLLETKLAQCMKPFEQMTAILSAMAHDVDHPGLNQSFLKATRGVLTFLYKENSVLEHHHCQFGLALLHDTGLFSHFTNDQWSSFKPLFKSIILATDINEQPKYVQHFTENYKEMDANRNTCADSRHFILKMAMKCADVCNPCRKWAISEQWSRQVCDEFFNQAALERRLCIPVSPFFDPRLKTVADIQIGFNKGIVLPLVQVWHDFVHTALSQKMLDLLHANRKQWETIQATQGQAGSGKTVGRPRPASASSSMPLEAVPDTTQASSSRSAPYPAYPSSLRPQGKGKGPGKSRSVKACSVDEVIWLMGGDGDEEGEEVVVVERVREVSSAEEEEEEVVVEEVEEEEEEEEDGEEADTVENNVNLAFHYQTDADQMSEGGGCSLPLMTPEEQIKFLTMSARRHSMPVAVRRDLAIHPETRKDSRTCYNFLRRQSLPTATVRTWSDPRTEMSGGFSHREKSAEGVFGHTKPSHPSYVIDPQSFSFLPLQTQTQRLQQCAKEDNSRPPTFPHHPQPSASCLEFRRRSQVSREDTDRLRTAFSRMVSGVRTCHQELVGLANSWPSIRPAPEKVDEDELKLLADQLELPSPESSSDSSLSSSRSNSSDSIPLHFSPPPFLRLFARRH